MFSKVKNQLTPSIILAGRLLVNKVNNHFILLKTNITQEQLDVLIHITLDPEKKVTQNELAIVMNKNKSAVLRSVDILEKKLYVKRIPVVGDRRKNIIEATSEGIQITKRAMEIYAKLEKEFMEKINKSDVESCSKVIGIITSKINTIK
jgi:DNA-binding MarR family transcriptional regulator